MEFDVSIYPVRLEYRDNAGYSDDKYTVIVDLKENEIITEEFIFVKKKTKIKKYDIEGSIMGKLLEKVSVEELKKYAALSKEQKNDKGYRDGWFTECKVVFENGNVITSRLETIYKENPLENVLNYLRYHYPKIELLRRV